MLAPLLALALSASPQPDAGATAEAWKPPLTAFVKEGEAWTSADLLCEPRGGHQLVYLASPAQPGGPTELRWQPARDGKVTRRVAVEAEQGLNSGAQFMPPHQIDCGAGSCRDSFARGIAGQDSSWVFLGVRSNVTGEWAMNFTASRQAKAVLAPQARPELSCPGDRIYLRCLAPRWRIEVIQTGDINADPQVLHVSYRAFKGEGARPSLQIRDGKLAHDGNRYIATFTNKDTAYALSASADPQAPGAEVVITQRGKELQRIACTAYGYAAGPLEHALSGQP